MTVGAESKKTFKKLREKSFFDISDRVKEALVKKGSSEKDILEVLGIRWM